MNKGWKSEKMKVPQGVPVTTEAAASAALSLATELTVLLVTKGLVTKQEALDACERLADAKTAKGMAFDSGIEAEAGAVFDYLRDRLGERLPD